MENPPPVENQIVNAVPEDRDIPGMKTVSKPLTLPFNFVCTQTLRAHELEITCMILIKTTNELCTGSLDQLIKIWGVPRGKNNFALSAVLKGHTNSILSIKEFERMSCLCSCSVDKTLKLWDLKNLTCFATLSYHSKSVLCATYSPFDYTVFSGSDDSLIGVWQTTNQFSYSTKVVLKGHLKSVVCMVFCDNLSYLVSGSDDKTIRVWDTQDAYNCVKIIDTLNSEIDCLRYARNRLMASCEDGNINFINMNVMKRVRSVQFSPYAVYDFDTIDKEKYLIVASCDCKGRVWGIGTKQRALLEGHVKPVSAIVQLRNGNIVTASMDCTIKVWQWKDSNE